MGPRRRGRECAFQQLYLLDGAGPEEPLDQAIERYWSLLADSEEEPIAEEATTFAEALVRGVRGRLAELDDLLRRASTNWRLERMARVDRSLLRLATYELLAEPDTPTSVILDEAIELAQRFGSESSPSFVNGVLDQVARMVRP